MAISLVGTPTTGSAIDGADLTITMPTGLAENDVVYLATVHCDGITTGGMISAGWTRIQGLISSGAQLDGQLFRKIMGASPDANATVSGDDQGTSDSSCAVCFAFRGVDTTTPEDGVAPTSTTGSSTDPNPPTITPATTGAWIFTYAGTRINDTTGTAAPTGYSNFAQIGVTDSRSTSMYGATKSGLTASVAEDPAAFTGVSSATWWAGSVVLRPAPAAGGGARSYGFVIG